MALRSIRGCQHVNLRAPRLQLAGLLWGSAPILRRRRVNLPRRPARSCTYSPPILSRFDSVHQFSPRAERACSDRRLKIRFKRDLRSRVRRHRNRRPATSRRGRVVADRPRAAPWAHRPSSVGWAFRRRIAFESASCSSLGSNGLRQLSHPLRLEPADSGSPVLAPQRSAAGSACSAGCGLSRPQLSPVLARHHHVRARLRSKGQTRPAAAAGLPPTSRATVTIEPVPHQGISAAARGCQLVTPPPPSSTDQEMARDVHLISAHPRR